MLAFFLSSITVQSMLRANTQVDNNLKFVFVVYALHYLIIIIITITIIIIVVIIIMQSYP